MKKSIIAVLEQMYNTPITSPEAEDGDDLSVDVPNLSSVDGEYKTFVKFPNMNEDYDEPEIKTKKGKTVLREPPPEDPEENEIKDLDFLDKEGDEIEVDDDEDESLNEQKEPDKKDDEDEEDDNDMGSLAGDNIETGEQNPGEGEDPNTDPNEETPDPNAMMGGDQGQQEAPADDQVDPNAMGGDPSGGAGMDPNADPNAMGGADQAGGMPGAEEKDAETVGRIYELKKIYSRLLSIESQLSFSADIILLKLRKYITQSIDLFETLISNVDVFKDDIDEIIVMYYQFIEDIYIILHKYYRIKKKEDKEQNTNTHRKQSQKVAEV